MPCLTPYRGDTSQMLLFKIASCLEASGASGSGVTSFNGLTGAVTGVTSFNGRDGVVILSLADVAAVADGRYVLKAGDTMTGALVHPDGTAALPSITFTGDLDTGIYHPAANTIGLTAGGTLTFSVLTTGANVPSGLAYTYNSMNVIRAQTALGNYFFAGSGNLTMTGVNVLTFGLGAGVANTSGSFIVAVGNSALASNTTGSNNSANGMNALRGNTTGSNNLAVGFTALQSNTTADFNLAVGVASLISNLTGASNSGVGANTLFSNTSGNSNTAFGTGTLQNVTTGSSNTGIGRNTGLGITTGSSNTIIGANVIGLAAALSNNIILADGAGVIRLQIDSSGNTTLAGTVATAAGTAALPAHTFSADLNTGLYNIGADSVGLSTGGTLRVTTNTTDLILATAFRLAMASGANQRAGNAVLVGGTVTVANTSVTANTIILLTRKTAGGTIGFAVTYTVIAATSFTITSDNVLDTSTYSYLLVEVP